VLTWSRVRDLLQSLALATGKDRHRVQKLTAKAMEKELVMGLQKDVRKALALALPSALELEMVSASATVKVSGSDEELESATDAEKEVLELDVLQALASVLATAWELAWASVLPSLASAWPLVLLCVEP